MGNLCECLAGSTASSHPTSHSSSRPAVEIGLRAPGVIVLSGKRVCGQGAALGNTPLMQDKPYWAATIHANPFSLWGLGVALKKCDLASLPLGKSAASWVLRSDGTVFHADTLIARVSAKFEEGDVLGCSFDHVALKFYLNGRPLDFEVTKVKGDLYPAFYVDEGAVLDIQFDQFTHKPPDGFGPIMMDQSII
eukprot:m.327535 g.327535  ORF g.327535 m.327535 type:complete len:193 (-) comp55582_c0_seq8:951-1529(-)